MFLAEPAQSPGELHFRLFGVPVRVHPLFWLVSLLLGLQIRDGQLLILWVLCTFVSILVHEFGHVIAIQRYGARARVVLYSFGGLAITETAPYGHDWGRDWRPDGYDDRDRTQWQQIVISFAGPLAGFVLAAVVIGGLFATGHKVDFYLHENVSFVFGHGEWVANPRIYATVNFLLYINIFWGLMNLLPVYPLDGGKIAQELLSMHDARRGVRRSLVLSIATGAVVAVFVLFWQRGQGFFMAAMFGMLAYTSYMTLKAYDASRGYDDDYHSGRGW
jgi:stage IV sporulation protein FB